MNIKIQQKIESKKIKITTRLQDALSQDGESPVLSASNIQYEIGDRSGAIAQGGIGAIQLMTKKIKLVDEINKTVEVLKIHRPYHESDHVLNIAYNILCGGLTLDDIEFRRNDEHFLDALETKSIPDPTTAGDFCRRFNYEQINALMDAINAARLNVWQNQPATFLKETARINIDGSIVETLGECKEGMDIAYNGVWGYHPLIVSLANTQEVLYVLNRSGNRPSHEGSIPYIDKSIDLCKRGGFEDILLVGDTDFSITSEFDRWDDAGIRFIFGFDATSTLCSMAEGMPDHEYQALEKKTEETLRGKKGRECPENIKEKIIKERGFTNIHLASQEIVEFNYQPGKCNRSYRVVALRKNLTVEKGELALFDEIRYFFFITNDRFLPAEKVVYEAHKRCNQENLISQLKNGVHALHAPTNTLNSNWAYMVIAALAWNLKAWLSMMIPVHPRWKEKHNRERKILMRMEFRTFLNTFIMVPAQIIRTGRRIVYRFLSWNSWQHVFFRLLDALKT